MGRISLCWSLAQLSAASNTEALGVDALNASSCTLVSVSLMLSCRYGTVVAVVVGVVFVVAGVVFVVVCVVAVVVGVVFVVAGVVFCCCLCGSRGGRSGFCCSWCGFLLLVVWFLRWS